MIRYIAGKDYHGRLKWRSHLMALLLKEKTWLAWAYPLTDCSNTELILSATVNQHSRPHQPTRTSVAFRFSQGVMENKFGENSPQNCNEPKQKSSLCFLDKKALKSATPLFVQFPANFRMWLVNDFLQNRPDLCRPHPHFLHQAFRICCHIRFASGYH